MTMWDDLMNTFSFPPEPAAHHAGSSGQNKPFDPTSPVHSLSPTSNPCSPHVSLSTSNYTFPNVSIPCNGSSAGEDLNSIKHSDGRARGALRSGQQAQQPQAQHAFLVRSSSNKDLKDSDMDTGFAPVPYMRPRVYTWGSAMSDSVNPDMNSRLVGSQSSVGVSGRSIGANKRRATCPDSMRNYRGRSTLSRAISNGMPSSVVKPQFAKIEDVESDLSDDDTGGQQDVNSSGDASTASDLSFETHLGTTELVILRQPESHHRARYQKEGSRGCIKDRTGNSCPAVQLRNYNGAAVVLQAFIGTESGPIRPHPLYRVCKVGGKHSTPCRERILDNGITALEMDLTRENSYILNVDCLGIMKLRNADFEQVFDAEDLAKRRKRSPKVRLVFRAILTLTDGRSVTLQVISTPICCTPSPGVPEIHFISHTSCQASGGIDIVVIGRNFVKDDSKLFISEKNPDDVVVWDREITLLQENFNQVHLVGSLPAYRDPLIGRAVQVNLFVRNKGGKQSEPHKFTYLPDELLLQKMAKASAPLSPAVSPMSLDQSTIGEVRVGRHMTTTHATLADDTVGLPIIHIPQQYSQSATINGQNLQYCIQLPGSLQPIIITIPQSVTSNAPLDGACYSAQMDSQDEAASRQLSYQNTDATVTTCGVPLMAYATSDPSVSTMPVMPSLSTQSDHQPVPTLSNDEDLFNELLREILGTTDMSSSAEFTGEGSGVGSINNSYQSQADSPTAMAALSAARSFRAMDINRPGHGSGSTNYGLDDQPDDFMG